MNYPSPRKKSTGNRYSERINHALRFIDANLDRAIGLKEIAEASRFSIFHFHRIFHALMGETVNDYVGRKRLERAANLLFFRKELSITDVSIVTGFSSSANFAKSFKLYFGVSPSEIRKPATGENSKTGKIFSKYGKVFNPADLYPPVIANTASNSRQFEDICMNVNIVDLKQQAACALASPAGYEAEALFKTWDRLIAWARSNGIEEKNQQRFALCYDNPAITPIGKCRYEASIVVNPDAIIAGPFFKQIIPAGKYAVARFRGAPEDTANFHVALYSTWLPDSGFEPDDFPLMERYLNDIRKDGYVEMDVYIKLKQAA